jgi:hypothetical protein
MPSSPTTSTALIDSQAALLERMTAPQPGVVLIKPRVLLEKLEHGSANPVPLALHMPPSGLGSVTMIEAAMLVALIRMLAPSCIVEFGTFRGYSTALMVRNAGLACRVISLDLGDLGTASDGATVYTAAELRSDDRKNDDYLRHVQSTEGTFYLSDLTPQERHRVSLLHCDSRTFDVTAHQLDGAVDMVFIDGGHDFATIASDTARALQMASKSSVIVWHDFNSSIHGDVTAFVNGFAAHYQILHVQNTMLAILLVGGARDTFCSFGADASVAAASTMVVVDTSAAAGSAASDA